MKHRAADTRGAAPDVAGVCEARACVECVCRAERPEPACRAMRVCMQRHLDRSGGTPARYRAARACTARKPRRLPLAAPARLLYLCPTDPRIPPRSWPLPSAVNPASLSRLRALHGFAVQDGRTAAPGAPLACPCTPLPARHHPCSPTPTRLSAGPPAGAAAPEAAPVRPGAGRGAGRSAPAPPPALRAPRYAAAKSLTLPACIHGAAALQRCPSSELDTQLEAVLRELAAASEWQPGQPAGAWPVVSGEPWVQRPRLLRLLQGSAALAAIQAAAVRGRRGRRGRRPAAAAAVMAAATTVTTLTAAAPAARSLTPASRRAARSRRRAAPLE